MSKVSIMDGIRFSSHAGFFTIDENLQSNMYFWYFPAFSGNKKAPVLLWLQGGPGGSSLFGLFTELGPLVVTNKGFSQRKYHWALDNHLIFIDNPVGTGFSYTEKEEGYCNDEDCVAKNLYKCLEQFFTLFPDLKNNEFYITGESYAGKYIPSLAMEIHRRNQNTVKSKSKTKDGEIEITVQNIGNKEQWKINLQGLAMGNAFCDPINQIDYGSYLYQHGLIDDDQKQIFRDMQNNIQSEIKQKEWKRAGLLLDKLLFGSNNTSYIENFTGFNYYYNYLMTADDPDVTMFAKLLQSVPVRKVCHVGNKPFNSGEKVMEHLSLDILHSVAPVIEELLSHYRILFYNGQLDIIVAYPLTENFLRNLNFSSSKEYHVAKRKIWRVGQEVAGYVKKAGNLTEILVRNAGHMVPSDQPKWALDMITRFIRNKF
ncbi:serine carboxypeptidase domain-containing protein [Phthorimaea operculella]|nr:serine carboxypeptidase domain-containing protein [Phthorimaea operculella]